MCMYLVNGNTLGKRLISFEVYDSKSKGFLGFSEKQLMDKLKKGENVYGLKLVKDGESEKLQLDAEGFNMTNLQLKSGVNTLSFLTEMADCDINAALIVVATFTENGKRGYETVNARHARVVFSESKLKMMADLGIPVAGVKIAKNRITVCEGVEDLDKKEGAANE